MAILITGAAGFIGYHCTKALLARGEEVVGIDNFNAYYDVALKEARLAQLARHKNFRLIKLDITDKAAVAALPKTFGHIIHLAAQAGVRYSLKAPQTYIDTNITGQLNMLELAQHTPGLKHFVYASSSSVYGGNKKTPFSIQDPVAAPVSIYAMSKRAGELMAHSFAHLYRIPATGLRFFTVYGPWGRPDMAAYLFTQAIMQGKPIDVFNHGKMARDFTYIDDIVSGVLAVLERPPQSRDEAPPHRLYNLGNAHPEQLSDFIAVLERALGKKAVMNLLPMQAGDVPTTYADITESTRDFGFKPSTGIDEGIARFVAWYKSYHAI